MTAILFVLNLFLGSVDIPVSGVLAILTGGDTGNAAERFIVLGSRLPMAITAMLGARVSLQPDCCFRQPSAILSPGRRYSASAAARVSEWR